MHVCFVSALLVANINFVPTVCPAKHRESVGGASGMLAHLIWLGPGCEGGRDQNLRSQQGKLSGPSSANICFQACTASTGGYVLGRFYRPCSAWGRTFKPAAAVNERHAANEDSLERSSCGDSDDKGCDIYLVES